MRLRDCGMGDEIFTHIDDDTREIRHFNATRLARDAGMLVAAGYASLYTVPMDHEFIALVEKYRGIEEWKVARLCDPYLSAPVLGVEMEDGQVLTVDGHHRLVRHAREGREMYGMYVICAGRWLEYLVTDMPEGFGEVCVEEVLSQQA